MSTFLKVNIIEASKHKSGKFVALSIYFSSENNAKQLVYVSLTYEIHLVKSLKANLLIRNNIIFLKGFVIDVKEFSALIKSCKMIIPINT